MEGQPRWTLKELAKETGSDTVGDPDLQISRLVPAGISDPAGIALAENARYLELALDSTVGAVIVAPEVDTQGRPALVHPAPRQVFQRLLSLAERPQQLPPGIHETAVVGPGARVDPSARLGPYCVVDSLAEVGADSQVFPFCYVGPRCVLGRRVTLMPSVILVQDVALGEGTVVHSGAVLGADGFGFVWDGSSHVKVPQTGEVAVGEKVEIGANTTIDRATCGPTVIEDGVKLDNLVQVGHNAKVGKDSVIAGQTGISGSVVIGRQSVVGGQVAFADHVFCADGVRLGGRSAVMSDIKEPGEYLGTPALPAVQAIRALTLQSRLPELLNRLRELEKQVERLTNGS